VRREEIYIFRCFDRAVSCRCWSFCWLGDEWRFHVPCREALTRNNNSPTQFKQQFEYSTPAKCNLFECGSRQKQLIVLCLNSSSSRPNKTHFSFSLSALSTCNFDRDAQVQGCNTAVYTLDQKQILHADLGMDGRL